MDPEVLDPAVTPRVGQRRFTEKQSVFRAGWHHKDDITEARGAQADKDSRWDLTGWCSSPPGA